MGGDAFDWLDAQQEFSLKPRCTNLKCTLVLWYLIVIAMHGSTFHKIMKWLSRKNYKSLFWCLIKILTRFLELYIRKLHPSLQYQLFIMVLIFSSKFFFRIITKVWFFQTFHCRNSNLENFILFLILITMRVKISIVHFY